MWQGSGAGLPDVADSLTNCQVAERTQEHVEGAPFSQAETPVIINSERLWRYYEFKLGEGK